MAEVKMNCFILFAFVSLSLFFDENEVNERTRKLTSLNVQSNSVDCETPDAFVLIAIAGNAFEFICVSKKKKHEKNEDEDDEDTKKEKTGEKDNAT